jgi:NAD+ synthase (glutamine-hydrolysing)
MNKNLRVALAQINLTVGDLESNYRKIADNIQKARESGSDIVIFPELAITGYPPEDLLLKARFVDDNISVLKKLSKTVSDIVAVVGFADRTGNDVFNAAAVIYDKTIEKIYHKMLLPNYGVFDEKRYFKAGSETPVFKYGDFIFGVNICEDIWHSEGPCKKQASEGASFIINISSSPYYAGKVKDREAMVRSQAKDNNVTIVYTNLVGGQDELVFDGQSMVIDNSGKVIYRAHAFKEDLLIADINIPEAPDKAGSKAIKIADKLPVKSKPPLAKKEIKGLDYISEVYEALLLGMRDYVIKNGFTKVGLGMSGGIDSSLVAAIASDALGKENVTGVYMPSRYSSSESEMDAKSVSGKLGINFMTASIEQLFKIYLMALEQRFSGRERDITEENLQARIRGNILMALSNKFGWLILTTGNKSEMSTGYATLYGDMAGGFAVIKDCPKTLVYKLAKYRNSIAPVIPESVFTKEPTAELRMNQKDRDTLPPYDILDPILKAYVEEDKDIGDIIPMGFDKETVTKVLNMVDRSEYKRRQSPPGVKITPKAFGRDRRMPITNGYRWHRNYTSLD